jgi:3'(2'), 5'-bisphosphate nucleotidase
MRLLFRPLELLLFVVLLLSLLQLSIRILCIPTMEHHRWIKEIEAFQPIPFVSYDNDYYHPYVHDSTTAPFQQRIHKINSQMVGIKITTTMTTATYFLSPLSSSSSSFTHMTMLRMHPIRHYYHHHHDSIISPLRIRWQTFQYSSVFPNQRWTMTLSQMSFVSSSSCEKQQPFHSQNRYHHITRYNDPTTTTPWSYRHILRLRRGGSSSSSRSSMHTKINSDINPNNHDDDNNNNNNHNGMDDSIWNDMIPIDMPYRDDIMIAFHAVRRACQITMQLQPHGDRNWENTNTSDHHTSSSSSSSSTPFGIVQKIDYSPVTVADYAVQASILQTLYHHYPKDGFIAEEDSTILRTDPILSQQVYNATCYASLSSSNNNNNNNTNKDNMTEEQLWHSIDLGQSFLQWNHHHHDHTNSTDHEPNTIQSQSQLQPPPSRIWCLDPIDGTRGFLRGKYHGGQYCIALSLIQHGIPIIGILGCPNLPTVTNHPTLSSSYEWNHDEIIMNQQQQQQQQQHHHRGCIFIASQHGGCYQIPLFPTNSSSLSLSRKLHVTCNDDTSSRTISNGRFCVGVERYSDAYGYFDQIAHYIQQQQQPQTSSSSSSTNDTSSLLVRMDSQVKHGVIARGDAEYYMRLPKKEYIEYKWDHAAGYVIIQEAGGMMTDTYGQTIDFSLKGNQLSPHVRGVLMSNGGRFHQSLVNAYQSIVNRTKE